MIDIGEPVDQNINKEGLVEEIAKEGSDKIAVLNKIFIVLIIIILVVGLGVKSFIQGQAKIASIKNQDNSVILNQINDNNAVINSSAAAGVVIPTSTPTVASRIPVAIPTLIPTSTSSPTAKPPTSTPVPVTSSFRTPTIGSFEVSANVLYMNSALTCSPDPNRKIAAGIWDFGDGVTHVFQILDSNYSSSPGKTESINTGHSYTSSGTYTVVGKCKDDLGNLSSSASKSITVSDRATIDSISPSSGTSGQTITIKGSFFGAETGTINMCLSGNCNYPPTINSWSNTEIKVQISGMITQTGAYDVRVVIKNGTPSNGVTLTITAGQPRVDSISPSGAKPGAELTLSGAHFGSSGQVNFYKTYPTLSGSGSVTSWSDTQIRTTIPSNFEGNTEYGIQVVSGGTESSFKYYTLGAN
jgi:hypothetical protein